MYYFDDDEDCFEEEDLYTNFGDHQLPLYEEAVKQYGDKDLYISDQAFDCKGRQLTDCHSLRTKTEKCDISKFWRIFDKLRTEF